MTPRPSPTQTGGSGGDGYADAFSEIGKMLGISLSPLRSPRQVWENEMRPKLQALLATPNPIEPRAHETLAGARHAGAVGRAELASGRGIWLTDAWDAFCDCDELPEGIDYQAYLDWLDETPLVGSRAVEPDDLEDPFAWERGIVPDGSVYFLTPLGKQVREWLLSKEGEGR